MAPSQAAGLVHHNQAKRRLLLLRGGLAVLLLVQARDHVQAVQLVWVITACKGLVVGLDQM